MALRIKNSIPNTITCLNLLSGCVACILAFHYAEPMGSLYGFQWAFICIGAATVFDFADGASARMLHAYSAMGKELDSLADLVSFGLAPALLMFNAISLAFPSASGLNIWAFGALLIAVLGALRLAKFNIDTRQTTSFIGLPIPSNAIFWIGFLAWAHTHGMPPIWLTFIIIAGVSLLLVPARPDHNCLHPHLGPLAAESLTAGTRLRQPANKHLYIMGTFLLLLFIFFIVIPLGRVIWTVSSMRRKARKAMEQMAERQQREARRREAERRPAGWSSARSTEKIFSKADGEYVDYEEVTVSVETEQTASYEPTNRRMRRGATMEQRIIDVEWEDIPD